MNLKPKAGFVKNELNAERLTPLQWDGIMRAMDKYALHFHDVQRKVNGTETSQGEALHKHSVVGMCCENPGKNMMRVGEDMFKCNQCGKLHEI